MLTIVQPTGQSYLAFEAEDPQATIVDLDNDGYTWQRVTGGNSAGVTTAASGGGAIMSYRNAAETANNEGQISYPIQLTNAGPYFFYARTKYSSSGGDNSMYVPPNDGPINADPSPQWDNLADASTFREWKWVSTDNANAQYKWTNPTPGAPTTLKFNIREMNYFVDKIVLSETEMTPEQLDALAQVVQATPAPPPDLNGILVNYTAVTDATGYNILRGTSASGPFSPVTGAQGITDLTFTDNTLPANSSGQTFYYVVDALTPTGNVRSAPVPVIAGSGLISSHYETRFFQDNPDNDSDPHVRTDDTLDMNWGSDGPTFLSADASDADPDNTWSIIFNGRLRPSNTGEYTFYTGSDDGIEIQIVDPDTGNVILSGPNGGIQFLRGIVYPYQDVVGKVNLTAGKFYNIRVLWSENGGGAAWRVAWSGPNTPFQVIPNDVLFQPDSTIAPTGRRG